jgi:hypothetical protein
MALDDGQSAVLTVDEFGTQSQPRLGRADSPSAPYSVKRLTLPHMLEV